MTTEDRVTVVIATRDRWSDLEQTLPHHEAPVILVDNGSSDGTPDRVRERYPHVDVVELPENRGAVARNIGVERAATPYVAFADDDSWWTPGALTRAADALDAHDRLGLLAARMLVGEQQRPDPVCALMADSPLGREPDLPGPSVLGFLACGAVVRKRAFLATGGFDDVIFFMGEEEMVALDLARMGWGLAYVEEVVARHNPSPARDPDARAALAARNHLLTLLMRRPWPVVAQTVAADLRGGPPGRRAVVSTARRLPRALARRRPVPAPVERAVRSLERPGRRSAEKPARRPDGRGTEVSSGGRAD
jgi:GT2 family glycosyltransferase